MTWAILSGIGPDPTFVFIVDTECVFDCGWTLGPSIIPEFQQKISITQPAMGTSDRI